MNPEFKRLRQSKFGLRPYFQQIQDPPKNYNQFLFNNLSFGSQTQRYDLWSEQETEQLIDLIQKGVTHGAHYINPDGLVQWGILSMYIPGRTRKQCYDKYMQMLHKGEINSIKELTSQLSQPVTHFNAFTQRALLPGDEESLINTINDMIDQNEYVDTNIIKTLAIDLYYDPLHLARKAIINDFIEKGIHYLDSDGNYIDEVQYPDESILNIALENPHQLMEDYQIQDFSASPAWISNFMRKYDFVFRKAHLEKRGAIDQNYVATYLCDLRTAIHSFSPEKILNMDETYILLDYSSKKTIARKGQKVVKIQKQYLDQKEGTTYVATISMDPNFRLPLYCIAKGTSYRCEEKYENDDFINSCCMDHSKTGWSNMDVMYRYINLAI